MDVIFPRTISGCGLSGFINTDGKLVGGESVIKSIELLRDRSNGLGGGFAGYGIYPNYPDHYALHIMYEDGESKDLTEAFLERSFRVEFDEPIPTRPVEGVSSRRPILHRYFVKPLPVDGTLSEDDFVVERVMKINDELRGAYVFSSGKNMGVFKGVGYAHDLGRFFRLDEYGAYIWISHGRFPTNTPGWWGGAHPFNILDWSIVHNGEISSYGINRRYLEMYGYRCNLQTDTEVVAYLLDLLIRRHRIPLRVACNILAPPFWADVDRMGGSEGELYTALRSVYGSCLLNGPFAILFAFKGGLVGLNDRVKLRPLVAGVRGDTVYMSSEESGILAMCPKPDEVWMPRAGDPVIALVRCEGAGIESPEEERAEMVAA
ncbi:MAG: class II glutamine amidotransferase [bacterium]